VVTAQEVSRPVSREEARRFLSSLIARIPPQLVYDVCGIEKQKKRVLVHDQKGHVLLSGWFNIQPCCDVRIVRMYDVV
jgi:hypothetical protein